LPIAYYTVASFTVVAYLAAGCYQQPAAITLLLLTRLHICSAPTTHTPKEYPLCLCSLEQ